MVGWLNGWLVGNAVFSETALRIFLIFCMKLGDYIGRKKIEPDFWKKLMIWRYSRKGLQIGPKSDTLIFFSKTAETIFLVFALKLVLSMTFNLVISMTAIWRYLISKSSKKVAQIGEYDRIFRIKLCGNLCNIFSHLSATSVNVPRTNFGRRRQSKERELMMKQK